MLMDQSAAQLEQPKQLYLSLSFCIRLGCGAEEHRQVEHECSKRKAHTLVCGRAAGSKSVHQSSTVGLQPLAQWQMLAQIASQS